MDFRLQDTLTGDSHGKGTIVTDRSRHDPADSEPHRVTMRRFDDPDVARRYAERKNLLTPRNRREWTCIRRCLAGLPSGSSVLDLPCGTGRLIIPLRRHGFEVTAADSSRHMIDVARDHYLAKSGQTADSCDVRFLREDVMATDFPNGEFDAVVCNRLLHHYPSAELRRRALRELRRVSRNRVIVSYFSNFALSAARFHLRARLRARVPHDRVPIWFSELALDLRAVGLSCVGRHSVRLGLSPQTYLHLQVEHG